MANKEQFQRKPVPISQQTWQRAGEIQIEAPTDDPLQNRIVFKQSDAKKIAKRLNKEAAEMEQEAGKCGLSGLTLYEKVMGMMCSPDFQSVPDPISEVRASRHSRHP